MTQNPPCLSAAAVSVGGVVNEGSVFRRPGGDLLFRA